MSIFTMPSLGADMEEGKLAEWLVAPGDAVARGDIVAVVETQKGAIEIEIFEAGEVAELIAEPGQTLPVGAPLARIRKPGEEEEDVPEAAPETAAPVTSPTPQSAPTAPPPPPPPPPHAGGGGGGGRCPVPRHRAGWMQACWPRPPPRRVRPRLGLIWLRLQAPAPAGLSCWRMWRRI
ncbi:MAG: hypothetical protein JJU42_03000 [Rhodobacteraceae bacterium]|nr:hypothetical protein [Paracoccaceae bacterium]